MDQKRTRVPMACDLCRSKKLRCDGGVPSCSRCSRLEIKCNYTAIQKRTRQRKSSAKQEQKQHKQHQQVSLVAHSPQGLQVQQGWNDLDARMRLLESQMSYLVDSLDPDALQREVETGSASSSEAGSETPDLNIAEDVETPQPDAKPNVNQMFGNQCSFSVISARGIQLLTRLTGDQDLLAKFDNFRYKTAAVFITTNNMWLNPIEKAELQPMPAKATTLALLNKFSSEFLITRLFLSRAELDELFDKYYQAAENPESAKAGRRLTNSDFLLMNIVISIGAIALMGDGRSEQIQDFQALQTLQKKHFENAIFYFNRVSLVSEGMRSIQALMLMTVYSAFVKSFPQANILVSTMVWYAQEMGLHRRESLHGLSHREALYRRRIWLCVYMFDRDSCFKTGRPPVIQQHDVSSVQEKDYKNVIFFDVPEDIVDKIMAPDYNLVNAMKKMTTEEYERSPYTQLLTYCYAHLNHFTSYIYSELYGARCLDGLSLNDVLNKIENLNNKFDELNKRLPQCASPSVDFSVIRDPNMKRDLTLFHMQYYSSIILINKLAFTKTWMNPAEEYRAPSHLQMKLMTLCLDAARKLMGFVNAAEFVNPLSSNHSSFHFFSALFTLFTGIIEFPTAPHVKSDLEMVLSVKTDLLGHHAVHSMNTGDTFTYNLINYCVRFFSRIAIMVYNKANNENTSLTVLDQELRHFDRMLTRLTVQISKCSTQPPSNTSPFDHTHQGVGTMPLDSGLDTTNPPQAPEQQHDYITNQMYSTANGNAPVYAASNTSSSLDVSSPFFQELGDFPTQSEYLLNQYTMGDFESQRNSTVLQQMLTIPNVFLNTYDQEGFNLNSNLPF